VESLELLDLSQNEQLAVKYITGGPNFDYNKLIGEVSILASLNHRCIIRIMLLRRGFVNAQIALRVDVPCTFNWKWKICSFSEFWPLFFDVFCCLSNEMCFLSNKSKEFEDGT
jgi:hypothetical protein